MKSILIINGAEKREPMAHADLAHHITRFIGQELQDDYHIDITDVAGGYDIQNERAKFLAADIIVYHTPVFWFNLSSVLKQYIDDVFAGGTFFIGRRPYGTGGLLTDKRYMLSTTWNAKATDLTDADGFLGGRTTDDIFAPLHLASQYVGMRPLPTLSIHDVVHNPDITAYDNHIKQHLAGIL